MGSGGGKKCNRIAKKGRFNGWCGEQKIQWNYQKRKF